MKNAVSESELKRAQREGAQHERQRISQELHDHLCQHLLGAAFAAKALAQRCDSGSALRAEAEEVARLINASVAQVRDVVRGLSPAE